MLSWAEQDTYTRVSVCPELAFIRTAGFQQPTAPCATCEGQSLWSHGDVAAIFYLLRKSKRNELDYTPASRDISELTPDGHTVAGQLCAFSETPPILSIPPHSVHPTHTTRALNLKLELAALFWVSTSYITV